MRAASFVLALSLVACGKRSVPAPPPPPKETKAATVEAPPERPAGVIGCGNFRVAIPNDARTEYVYLKVDGEKLGPIGKWDLAYQGLVVNATLEVYEKPVTGEAYCTDMGTETQKATTYVAVSGKVTFEVKDDLLHAVVEHARFVDSEGHIREVARRECSNVRIKWLPG